MILYPVPVSGNWYLIFWKFILTFIQYTINPQQLAVVAYLTAPVYWVSNSLMYTSDGKWANSKSSTKGDYSHITQCGGCTISNACKFWHLLNVPMSFCLLSSSQSPGISIHNSMARWVNFLTLDNNSHKSKQDSTKDAGILTKFKPWRSHMQTIACNPCKHQRHSFSFIKFNH